MGRATLRTTIGWGRAAILLAAGVFTTSPLFAQSSQAPALSIQWDGGNSVVISWSNSAPGYILETSDSFPPTKPWQGVSQIPNLQGSQAVVTQVVATTGGTQFYRLVGKGNQAGLDYLLATQNGD